MAIHRINVNGTDMELMNGAIGDAGTISFVKTQPYEDGTVGKELSALSNNISIEDGTYSKEEVKFTSDDETVVYVKIDSNGIYATNYYDIEGNTISNSIKKKLMDYDYIGLIGDGQSLGAGWAHGIIHDKPQFASNMLMWGTSHKLAESTHRYTKLNPYYETYGGNNANGETSDFMTVYSCLERFVKNGTPLSSLPKFIIGNTAIGGASITGLNKGTSSYNKIITEVTKSYEYCKSINKTYSVGAVTWVQGETNLKNEHGAMEPSLYKLKLKEFIDDINNDVKNITNQDNDVKLICYQCPTLKTNDGDFSLLLKFNEAALEHKNIVLGASISDSKFVDFYHIDALSTCRMGTRFGSALYGLMHTDNYITVFPNSYDLINENTIIISFDVPYPPLKLNTINENIPNYGFKCYNEDGNDIVSEVSVYSPTQIKLVANESLNGKIMRYSETTGFNDGYKCYCGIGGVTDSMGYKFEYDGSEYTFDNLSPIFEIKIN